MFFFHNHKSFVLVFVLMYIEYIFHLGASTQRGQRRTELVSRNVYNVYRLVLHAEIEAAQSRESGMIRHAGLFN